MMQVLTLPEIPTKPKAANKSLEIPWIVLSLLHSQGVDTATLKIKSFLSLTSEELDKLGENLLEGLKELNLRQAVEAFVNQLRWKNSVN